MNNQNVPKPNKRSNLRKLFGREYFIAKRRLKWLANASSFARPIPITGIEHSIFRHKTMMLRPLRDVEMYLQHNKITNLRLAIAPINGVVIKPGQTFSLWRLVGRPTAAKGYLEGLVLHNGRLEKGIGGGLCQLGNLLYWMALHSPLTVTERYRHGFDVFPDINRKIPFACGATLSYNYIDIQLTNNTTEDFRIDLWIDDEYLNGELLGSKPSEFEYEVFETDHLIKMQPWGGYTRHNRIWKRSTSLIDGMLTEELVTENHAIMMYNPLLSA
ncbi:MAG TPA: VanW family protein [Pyrinomonadaceae bacterium]|nr:VanW family protein [Chloracidobacterium sp.]MBP9934905.1 VanW family protein [Pyrinomonadaceae bacterium]MBK7803333.1 VanW family protein [Chloracidobacterium sp.]MBK9438582.1 VanW family protein [Chloracidobacterium sp.]MBL0241106.1 VanW family protein [Chloracidobacterium sp.]